MLLSQLAQVVAHLDVPSCDEMCVDITTNSMCGSFPLAMFVYLHVT